MKLPSALRVMALVAAGPAGVPSDRTAVSMSWSPLAISSTPLPQKVWVTEGGPQVLEVVSVAAASASIGAADALSGATRTAPSATNVAPDAITRRNQPPRLRTIIIGWAYA
jgi:hypothetical protein